MKHKMPALDTPSFASVLGLGAFCFANLTVESAFGLEATYGLFSEAEYSDNLYQRSETPGSGDDFEGGTKINAGVRFSLEQNSSAAWLFGARGEFSRERFPNTDTSDSRYEDRKQADVSLLYKPTTNNFRLNVFNSLRQTVADQTSLQEVGNRQDVNLFSAEPSYFVRLNDRSRVDVFYRYARVDEEFEVTSRVIDAAGGGYAYSLSDRFTWSINGVRSSTEYTEINSEYEQQDVFFRVAYDSGLTRLALDLGQQEILDTEDAEETLKSVSILRRLNSASEISLNYRSGYSDPFSRDLANEIAEIAPNEDVVYFDGVAVETEWSAFYAFERAGFSTQFGYAVSDLHTDDSVPVLNPIDERRKRAEAQVNYLIPFTRYQLSLVHSTEHRDLAEQPLLESAESEIKVNETFLRFSYLATPRADAYLQFGRRVSEDVLSDRESQENTVVLGFVYSSNR